MPVAIGYAIMIALWPSALLSPILHPYRVLSYFSSFSYPTKVQLGGEWFLSTELPARYLPQIFSVEMPEVLVVMALPAIIYTLWRATSGWADCEGHSAICYSLIAIAALFPPVYVIAKRVAIYDNMRHFLFSLCLIVAMLGLAWSKALDFLGYKSKSVRNGLIIMVLLLLGTSVARTAVLHPYEYAYKNIFGGGIPGAQEYYDTEYWLTSMPEAAKVVLNHAIEQAVSTGTDYTTREYTVLFTPSPVSADSVLPENFKIEYLIPEIGQIFDMMGEKLFSLKSTSMVKRYDYIVLSTRWHCDTLFSDLPIIGTVERGGMVFAVIRYNENPTNIIIDEANSGNENYLDTINTESKKHLR